MSNSGHNRIPNTRKEALPTKTETQVILEHIIKQRKMNYVNLSWYIYDICNSPFRSVMGVLTVRPRAIIGWTYEQQHNLDFGFELPRDRSNAPESDSEISPSVVAHTLENELSRRLSSLKIKVDVIAKRGNHSGYYGVRVQTSNNIPEYPSVAEEKTHRGILAYNSGYPHIVYNDSRPPQPITIGQKVILEPYGKKIETLLMHETLFNKYGNPYDNYYWRGYRGINFPVGTIIKVI